MTDTKKLQEMLDDSFEDNMEISKKSTKKRYTYDEVKAITEIQVKLAKGEISFEAATKEVLKISERFPVHNLVQYNKQMKDRLNGTTNYGLAIPSNWAKALLEVTGNDSMVIKALKEQQRLYKEKDGRSNQTLEDLLNGLENNMNIFEIKIGKFVKEHIDNIINLCENEKEELDNLRKISYSRDIVGLGVNFSFIGLSNNVEHDRYWTQEYIINNSQYRFCSQFGGSQVDETGLSRSEREGKMFKKYLIDKNILLDKYKNKEIKFVVD